MKQLLLIAVVVMTILCSPKKTAGVWIEDVHTEPNQPTDVDIITIVASGKAGAGPVWIDDSVFRMEDTSLELDIFFTLGFYGMITPWTYSEIIGTLPANDYDLTVRGYNYDELAGNYFLSDTYLTGFTVVPEPATLLLLTMGAVWIRAGKRKT
jgi:hypothetical protein